MGRVQQIQSFSTLDGPGTRCVVFLQGCPVGCIFCHNPDSWEFTAGTEFTTEELLRRIGRFRSFLPSPGLTISGGEPLAQPEFTLSLIKEARLEGWHVAIDTSGWGSLEWFEHIIMEGDLVIFSVKHPLTPHILSRCEVEDIQVKLACLAKINTPVWLRYVLIPGWTDQPEAFPALAKIASRLPNLQKIEIIPYNSLAENKWKKLRWDSPIFHGATRTLTETEVRAAEEKVAGCLRSLAVKRFKNLFVGRFKI